MPALNPSLLLHPSGSQDRSGVITPTLIGSARTAVGGQYGSTWHIEEATTNHIKNPSFTTTGSAWIGGGSTITQETNASFNYAEPGLPNVNSGRWTITSLSSTPYIAAEHTLGNAASGQVWSGSMYVRGSRAGMQVRLGIYYRSSTTATLQSNLSPYYDVPVGSWLRIEYTAPAAPANTDHAWFIPGVNLALAQVNDILYVNSPQMERLGYSTYLAHGNYSTGYSWAGTTHASISSRTAGRMSFPSDGVFGTDEGTVVLRYHPFNKEGRIAAPFLLTDGGAFAIYRNPLTTTYTFLAGGTPLLGSNPTPDGFQTVVCQWKGGLKRIYVGTTKIAEGTYSTAVAPLTTMYVGNAGANSFNGRLESVMLFDKFLSAAERNAIVNQNATWSWTNLPTVRGVAQNRAFILG